MSEVIDVSSYIKKVSDIMGEINDKNLIVFRGEVRLFDQPCRPNIFRKGYLEKNKYFEKNLFDEMTANKLTEGRSYLEKAIDAQHGGFPSRLLDVTYNCLVALYFAVTPYYTEKEDAYDRESNDGISNDGRVFIFNIEKMFCPSGDEINNMYNSIVERKENCFLLNKLFSINHKFIDHIKLNNRIIAQQGALILFQGDEVTPIPKYCYRQIVIPCKYKAKIRKELNNLFGIHTGSIYPESTNLVNEMIQKGLKISDKKHDYESELDLVIYNLKKDLEYNYKRLLKKLYDNTEKKTEFIQDIVREVLRVEERILRYKSGLILERNIVEKRGEEEKKKLKPILKNFIDDYNELVHDFVERLQLHLSNYDIEFTDTELKISGR